MASGLASSAVCRGFETRSGQTKDYKIGICLFSAKHAILRSKSLIGIRLICQRGATCLAAECCFILKIQLRCWYST